MSTSRILLAFGSAIVLFLYRLDVQARLSDGDRCQALSVGGGLGDDRSGVAMVGVTIALEG